MFYILFLKYIYKNFNKKTTKQKIYYLSYLSIFITCFIPRYSFIIHMFLIMINIISEVCSLISYVDLYRQILLFPCSECGFKKVYLNNCENIYISFSIDLSLIFEIIYQQSSLNRTIGAHLNVLKPFQCSECDFNSAIKIMLILIRSDIHYIAPASG